MSWKNWFREWKHISFSSPNKQRNLLLGALLAFLICYRPHCLKQRSSWKKREKVLDTLLHLESSRVKFKSQVCLSFWPKPWIFIWDFFPSHTKEVREISHFLDCLMSQCDKKIILHDSFWSWNIDGVRISRFCIEFSIPLIVYQLFLPPRKVKLTHFHSVNLLKQSIKKMQHVFTDKLLARTNFLL
jgi:hypothetical protein